MFCTKCGANNEENSKFCYSCGNPLEVKKENQQPEKPVGNEISNTQGSNQGNSESTYWENQKINQPVMNASTPSQPTYIPGNQAYTQPQQAYTQPQQPQQAYTPAHQPTPEYSRQSSSQGAGVQKTKKMKPMIIVAPIIALVAVAVIIGFLTTRSNKGVLDSVLTAVQGTIEADSFEFEVEANIEDEYGTEREKANGIVEIDFAKKKLNFDIGEDGSRTVLYDGTIYDIYDDEIWDAYDASDEVDMIFDYYKDNKNAFNDISSINWEEAADEAGIPIDIDYDLLNQCVKQFQKNMNSTKYIKSICNKFEIKKTSDGTLYSFDVDAPKFVESIVDNFEPLLEEYNLDNQIDYIYDELDFVEECKVDITIKDNKLTNVKVDLAVDGDSVDLELKIDKYGKAKIDTDELEEYIEYYDESDY
jgi:hypothetical protein